VVREQSEGTKLEVFSGRQAKLNLIIFLILYSKKLLTSYDMYSEIRSIKGYRHTKRQSIDRRVKALHQQGWLKKDGIRPAKAHFPSPLYKLSIRAQAAIVLSKKDLNDFLQTAPESNIQIFVDSLSIYL
jgi:hypothetical protein